MNPRDLVDEQEVTTSVHRALDGMQVSPYEDGHNFYLSVQTRQGQHGPKTSVEIWCETHDQQVGIYGITQEKIFWTAERCPG